MISGIFSGISTYFSAFQFIGKHHLWSKAILSGLISLGIGAVLFMSFGTLGSYALDRFFAIFCEGWLQTEWGCEAANLLQDSWFSNILSFLISLIVVLFLFKYIVSVVLSPFLSTFSEEVEYQINGNKPEEVSLQDSVNDILRSLRLAIRNLIRELFWIIVFNILGLLIPVVGSILSMVGIFLYQSYFAGFGNLDLVLERRRMNVKARVQYIRRHKGMTIGNGAPFLFLSLVPVAGWFLAPILGVTAATMAYLKDEQKQQKAS
ncbi:MAG: EI24 domain-containing protein [Bacteroidota bacterium]